MALKEQRHSLATIAKHQRTFKIFLRWAHEAHELETIPKMEMVRVPRTYPDVWDANVLVALKDRLDGLICATKNRRQRWYYVLHKRFFWMAINTGMRAGEIVFLPLSAIDLDRLQIKVAKHARFNVKERRDKIVPINDYLACYLEGQLAMFPGLHWYLDDGRKNPAYDDVHALWTAFNRHYDELGVPDSQRPKGLHGFRATFASYAHNQLGWDPSLIALWLGHSTVDMTLRYIPDPDPRKQASLEDVNRHPPGLLATK